MINAKQVYGTYPHVQMRWYVERTYPDASMRTKAAHLGQLVGKFVANCNAQHAYRDVVPGDVDEAFIWADTQEGHDYWRLINRGPVPDDFVGQLVGAARPIKAPIPKPVPIKKRQVGWWS